MALAVNHTVSTPYRTVIYKLNIMLYWRRLERPLTPSLSEKKGHLLILRNGLLLCNHWTNSLLVLHSREYMFQALLHWLHFLAPESTSLLIHSPFLHLRVPISKPFEVYTEKVLMWKGVLTLYIETYIRREKRGHKVESANALHLRSGWKP